MLRASVRRVPLAGESQTVCVPEGASLGALVEAAFPDAFMRRFVVAMVDGREVAPDTWADFVPAGGAIINLCVRPGDGDSGAGKLLRTVLQIAVIAAAVWVGGLAGGGIMGAFAQAGVAIVGNLIINTLIPLAPLRAQGETPAPFYTVTGARNAARMYSPVSFVLGKHRFFPPLYGQYIQETVGDDVYLRVPFCLGPAPVAISDLKIGDTPLSSYEGVDIEQRLTADAPPHTLYTGDPDQTVVGVQLNTTATVRNTALDADEIEIVFGFRGGLGGYDSKQRKSSRGVSFEIKYRPAGSSDAWTTFRPTAAQANEASAGAGAPNRVFYYTAHGTLIPYEGELTSIGSVETGTYTVTRADPGRGFQRQVRFAVPRHPAGYEVSVRRLSAESTDSNAIDAVWWEILGSIKGYVDPFPEPGLASVVLRIKASSQLSGVIDTFNSVTEPIVPLFSSAAKASPAGASAASLTTTGVSRNAAEIVLNLYRGPQAMRPRADDRIDWPAWAAAAAWFEAQGLHYDEVIEDPIGRGELARRILASCYARPHRWGGKLSVIIDRDRGSEAPAQVFTPRNVANLRWRKSFPADVHAVRVAFNNADNGWQADETIVYLDGYDASNATIIETLPVSGKTDPDEVRTVARQFINNSLRQTETFSFDMDAEALTCRPGAYAVLLHDAIGVGLGSHRVASLEMSGPNVAAFVLDFEIPTESSDTLAARWRKEDGAGGFTVATEATVTRDPANAKRFVFPSPVATADAPAVENVVLIGRATEVALPVIVRDIAPDFGHRAAITCVPYAPERFVPDGTPLPPHTPMVSLPIAARPPAPVQLTVIANAHEIALSFTQPAMPRGVTLVGYETAVREYNAVDGSWQDRGPLPADARVFVAPPGDPGYAYDLRVVAVGRDSGGLPVRSDPLIVANVAAATTPAAPETCAASFATRTSAGGASQLVLTATWAAVDNPDVLDTRVEMLVSTGPDVWAEIGQARAILGRVEIHGLQVGRSYALGFVHLSRRGIASARTTISSITAPDTLVSTSTVAAAPGGALASSVASLVAADATLAAADAALNSAITSEATSRASADTLLTAQVVSLRNGVLPGRPAVGSDFTANLSNGTPAAIAELSAGTVVAVAGEGDVRQLGLNSVVTRGWLSVLAGRTYRRTWRAAVTVDGTANRLRGGFSVFDAAGVRLGFIGLATDDAAHVVADGWQTFTATTTTATILASFATAAYVRTFVIVGENSGGTASGATVQVALLLLEDITDIATTNAQVATNTSAIATETAARAAADSTLTANLATANAGIATNATAIATEAATRASADSTLTANLATANAAIATNATAIATEAASRASADSTLTANLATANAAITTNATALATETSTRASADTALTAQMVSLRNSMLPGRPAVGSDFTSVLGNGTPSAISELSAGTVVAVAGEGDVRQLAFDSVVTRGWLGIFAGHTYRRTWRAKVEVDGTANRLRGGFTVFDAAGVRLGFVGLATDEAAHVVADGWQTFSATVTTTTILASFSTAAYIRAFVIVGENTSGAASGATVRLSVLQLEDITEIANTNAQVATNATALATETAARASADSTLTANLATANAAIATNATAIATEASTRASADSTLTANLATANAAITTNATALATETAARASADSTLTANLATANAAVATNAGAIATINGAAAFWETIVSASGGDLAAVRLKAGAGGGYLELISTVLRLANVSNGAVVEVMRAIGGLAFFANPISVDGGGKRLTIGPGYGVTGSKVVLWFGADSFAPADQSRTNGDFAFGTDGNPYYASAVLVNGTALPGSVQSFSASGGWYFTNGTHTTVASVAATNVAATDKVVWELEVDAASPVWSAPDPAGGFEIVEFNGTTEIVLASGTYTTSPGGGDPVVSLSAASGTLTGRSYTGAVTYRLKTWRSTGNTLSSGSFDARLRIRREP